MKKNGRDLIIFLLAGILFIGAVSSTILMSIPKKGLGAWTIVGILGGTAAIFLGLYYFLVYRPKNRKGKEK